MLIIWTKVVVIIHGENKEMVEDGLRRLRWRIKIKHHFKSDKIEGCYIGEMRKQVETSSSNKKMRFSPKPARKEDRPKCGRTGHVARECVVKDLKGVECYSCHEKGHFSNQCPYKSGEGPKATGERKKETPKKGRCFQMTMEEAKETEDVVAGTILVDSHLAHVLFYSGASYSFVLHAFSKKLDGPLATLRNPYMIEIADGSIIPVNQLYPNCDVEIDERHFPIDLGAV
ncbi:hypothetical protein LXL04_038999 [Taraxacum kok-saghyz]